MNKARLLFLLPIVFLIVFAFVDSNKASASTSTIPVYVNGKKVLYDAEPVIINNRTMVPIRKTMEALGSNVKWDNDSKKINILKGNEEIVFQVGKVSAYKNGEKITLDAAPLIKENRTYLPLRFISETFHYYVKWGDSTRTVLIADNLQKLTPQGPIPVLMYHNINDSNMNNGSNISPQRFREHMEAIDKEGYNTITDYDLYNFLQKGSPLPENPILITFDDGYRSNYTYGYPVLKELGMKATINLITSRVIEEENLYPNEVAKISWDEARASQDVFTFQGHTHDFHYKKKSVSGNLRGVITGKMIKDDGTFETQAEFEDRLLNDLIVSKKMIEEQLGKEVITFAYPFGDYSVDTIRIAKIAGYKMAFTVKEGKVDPNNYSLFELNRITGDGALTAQELIKIINKY